MGLLLLLPGCTYRQNTVHSALNDDFGAANCIGDDTTFRCVEYVKNYDGDTITVNLPSVHPLFGKLIAVRIAGVDAAEIKSQTECEHEVALKTQSFVENKLRAAQKITLLNAERDKYFRIVAEVIVDDKSLGQDLLHEGLAYPYSGGTKIKQDWCKALKP